MIKKLCLILALLFLLGCLAGCGTARTEQDPTGPDAPGTAPDASASGAECTYTVNCYGAEDDAPVEGVVINFCTDTACTPVVTGERGTAVFTGSPMRYHVQIVKVPKGWKLAQEETEWYTEPFGEIYRLPFVKAGE